MRRPGAHRRRPRIALPVGHVPGHWTVHTFPPHAAVIRHGHIREDRVVTDGLHGVRICLVVGAGRYAEIAGLRIDGPEAAVGPDVDPGDVFAHGPDSPALRLEGRFQHREVGLAARARERTSDVGDVTLWRLEPEDEHVLGHPALVATHRGGDPQRMALLAEERVAAI